MFIQTYLENNTTVVKSFITRVFVGVEVAEVVGLLAELNLGIASTELFDQETVVSLHYLPHQLSWYCCHFDNLLMGCQAHELDNGSEYKNERD